MNTCYQRTRTLRAFLRGVSGLSVLVALLLGIAAQQVRAGQFTPAPVADTYVASGKPDMSFGSEPGLWVGHNSAEGYLIERALVGFAPAALPSQGSIVTSAKLRLYLGGMTPEDVPQTIQAYRVRSNWAETITWNDHLGLTVDSAPAASASIPATEGWYAWDVTAALQAWSDTRDTGNFSLLLRSDVTSGQHDRGFRSKEHGVAATHPYLEIAYDLPTPTATPTRTPTATPTRTPTATPGPVPPLVVTLSQSPYRPLSLLQYLITVKNPSDRMASSVVVTNPLPAGVTFYAVFSDGVHEDSQVRWSVSSLSPGAEWIGAYIVQLPTPAATPPFPTPTPHPPAHLNRGACVSWRYPNENEVTSTSCSRLLFWEPWLVWLPVLIRN